MQRSAWVFLGTVNECRAACQGSSAARMCGDGAKNSQGRRGLLTGPLPNSVREQTKQRLPRVKRRGVGIQGPKFLRRPRCGAPPESNVCSSWESG